MREILFRGKRIDNDKWITDSETYIKDGDGIWLSDEDLNVVKIIPETLGRFTGLTDKNGTKIYEGDIIKGKGKKVFAVEYSRNIAGFITKGFGVLCCPCMNTGTMKFYEVIGNIHDNPELLK